VSCSSEAGRFASAADQISRRRALAYVRILRGVATCARAPTFPSTIRRLAGRPPRGVRLLSRRPAVRSAGFTGQLGPAMIICSCNVITAMTCNQPGLVDAHR
jgi:hypothetical protein